MTCLPYARVSALVGEVPVARPWACAGRRGQRKRAETMFPPFSYCRRQIWVSDHAALVLADHDAARIESALENVERLAGLGIAAHEHVERGIAFLGPGVDRDMAFSQHRHARDAAAFLEGVKMDVEQRCSRFLHRIDESGFDPLPIIQALGFPKVDDQMATRIGEAILGNKVIFLVVIRRNNDRNGPRSRADARRPCFFVRRHQIKSSHSSTYPSWS